MRREHLRLPFLPGCGQLCLLTNQTAGFFNHQYLRKESIVILVFFAQGQSLRKCGFEATNFDWVWSGILLSNQIVGFFSYKYLWKESLDRWSSEKVASETTLFGEGVARCAQPPISNIIRRSYQLYFLFVGGRTQKEPVDFKILCLGVPGHI